MNKVARLECWEGRQRLDWGLNRGREGGRGLPPKKAKYGHHRERATKLSPARIARRCERTKLHPLSLSISLMLKRQCGALPCGQRVVNHKAMDC